MADMVDLVPAAVALTGVLQGITDDQLTAPTPCDGSTVADLLDHLHGLTQAFRAAATKELGAMTSTPPLPDGSRLTPDWRGQLPDRASELAKAWSDPAAWDGMTQVGGVTLPGEVAGRIALNEMTLHAWDLARATGTPYRPDPGTVRACLDALSTMYPATDLERRQGIFAAPVPMGDHAPAVDRMLAFSGRNPDWSAPA
jgi:uncharacterized protein (TIGR03086 family)